MYWWRMWGERFLLLHLALMTRQSHRCVVHMRRLKHSLRAASTWVYLLHAFRRRGHAHMAIWARQVRGVPKVQVSLLASFMILKLAYLPLHDNCRRWTA